MNHTDEQQKLHGSDMLQEQDELCLSSKAEEIEAVENRFLLGIHNGLHVAYYTEGSNFGLKKVPVSSWK